MIYPSTFLFVIADIASVPFQSIITKATIVINPHWTIQISECQTVCLSLSAKELHGHCASLFARRITSLTSFLFQELLHEKSAPHSVLRCDASNPAWVPHISNLRPLRDVTARFVLCDKFANQSPSRCCVPSVHPKASRKHHLSTRRSSAPYPALDLETDSCLRKLPGLLQQRSVWS